MAPIDLTEPTSPNLQAAPRRQLTATPHPPASVQRQPSVIGPLTATPQRRYAATPGLTATPQRRALPDQQRALHRPTVQPAARPSWADGLVRGLSDKDFSVLERAIRQDRARRSDDED